MSVFELETGDSISAFDAGFEQETLPPGANADDFDANGPNRFSIWIPSEHVTVNMGNAIHGAVPAGYIRKPHPGETPPPPTYTENEAAPIEVDAGFVVQTDNHVHFLTVGGGNGTPAVPAERTVVRLGRPVTVVKAGNYGVAPSANFPFDTDIGSAYPPPYTDWDGYAMLTEGGSYQESQENNLIVSGKADLRLVGNRTVLLGTPGQVHITADGTSSVVGIVGNAGANSTSDSRIDGTGKWAGSLRAETLLDAAMTGVAAGLGLAAVIDGFYRVSDARSPTAGYAGWAAPGGGDWGALALQTVGAAGGFASMGLAIKPMAPGGDVNVYASSSIKAVGTFSAGVHGGVMTTVSGGLVNLVSADAIMSISSILISSLAGMFTSVSGLKSVGIASQWGTAKVNGRQSAELSSVGKVFVAGGGDVQINSSDSQVYMHGAKGFYIGCGSGPATPVITPPPVWVTVFGPGAPQLLEPPTGALGSKYTENPGYGIQGVYGAPPLKNGIVIGAMMKANTFTGPAPDDSPATGRVIKILDDQILIQYKHASIKLQDTDIYIGQGLGADKIHLG